MRASKRSPSGCGGGNHTVYVNRTAKKVSTIPRHNEINENLARKICKDLQVPWPDV